MKITAEQDTVTLPTERHPFITRKVKITELNDGGWEVQFPRLTMLPLSGKIEYRDEIETFATAAPAQRFIIDQDKQFAEDHNQSVISSIEWNPYSKVGHIVVRAIT